MAAVCKGVTWGTEADITSGGLNLFASSIVPSGGYADLDTRDFGQGGMRTNNARLAASYDVSMSFELTYGQAWMTFLAGIMGTESTPAEQTVGQGDYLDNFDFASSTDGLFYTVCYSMETDRVMVMPSFQPTSLTIAMDINQPGTVTVQGIADNVFESSMNTVAEITALTDYFYEQATYGGANHYCWVKDYSAGVALSSTHDKEILGFTFSASRPRTRRYGLRAANTQFTKEPYQPGRIDTTLTIRHSELDNAGFDILGDWSNPGYRMAEIFVDGSVIGTTVRRSLKFQFPYLKVKGQLPEGHGVASNNGTFQPAITYDCLKAPAAPAGMAGVTNLARIAAIFPTRTAKWGT